MLYMLHQIIRNNIPLLSNKTPSPYSPFKSRNIDLFWLFLRNCFSSKLLSYFFLHLQITNLVILTLRFFCVIISISLFANHNVTQMFSFCKLFKSHYFKGTISRDFEGLFWWPHILRSPNRIGWHLCSFKGIVSWNKMEFRWFCCIAGNFPCIRWRMHGKFPA
jgi:hypothetical protein